MTDRRCVVTGLDVAAATGLGLSQYWQRTVSGASGIEVIPEYDSRYSAALAGRISVFNPADFLSGRLIKQTDRVTQLALVSAERALADAQVDLASHDPFECSVITSNATGGFEFSHREMQRLWTEGRESVSVYQCFAWFYAVNTGQISIRHGMKGPSAVLVAEQAGGLDAVGHALRTIEAGECSLAVTGGMESSFDPWGWVSHLASGSIAATRAADQGYCPFAPGNDTYVPGEGGAMLVVESNPDTGRKKYGTISGYASGFNPRDDHSYTRPLARTIMAALEDARVTPDDVDVVFADAGGVRSADEAEAEVLGELFGPRSIPVTAPKSGTGRIMAGAGPLDIATALLALGHNIIPPTPNVTVTDLPIDLVVGQPRTGPLETALVIARGHGGFISAVVVQK
ncbi:act minimal PKS chain-length factor (CLF/KS beta) [Tsukamurella pulmonis]|uniref:Act minimal PKS chain-length factor (CLF/KS beta) n=1 Tax=Tsukamurella pulmonis TaxID=47312 RepID=A0A1H1GC36_9ACTN|nr:beta-ketoacyl synthase N-terminal-like domain-containing protein [Tsukamurella pulmonis]SDR10488.1 act minimal PKS chain-length factor (CLF/KS beta) [Tsukamurella pulmonis]SUP17527.1 Actinorhodin polyketide putative beta-ketoacyl synthase 2 [Tsukamurella pulmonis]